MGLTVDQTFKIIQMVEAKWNPLELARQRTAKTTYDNVIDKWGTDPRVVAFADEFEKATGTTLFSPIAYSYGTSGFGQSFLREAPTFWSDYLTGAKTGKLWDALLDVGYFGGIEPSNLSFGNTTQAQIMQVALRTTSKNWARLSDVFSDMVINISLAKDTDELLAAVESFTSNLK